MIGQIWKEYFINVHSFKQYHLGTEKEQICFFCLLETRLLKELFASGFLWCVLAGNSTLDPYAKSQLLRWEPIAAAVLAVLLRSCWSLLAAGTFCGPLLCCAIPWQFICSSRLCAVCVAVEFPCLANDCRLVVIVGVVVEFLTSDACFVADSGVEFTGVWCVDGWTPSGISVILSIERLKPESQALHFVAFPVGIFCCCSSIFAVCTVVFCCWSELRLRLLRNSYGCRWLRMDCLDLKSWRIYA